MTIGPGKYDSTCTQAREAAQAEGAILIIFNGEHGQGFSVQAPPKLMRAIPALLHDIADQIQEDFKS